MSVLKPFLKKLSEDALLVTQMQSALGQKPADRSYFDNMVVKEIEKILELVS